MTQQAETKINKTVLITGASSGFGKLTAEKYAKEGWNVIASMRNPEKAIDLSEYINIFILKMDVTDSISSIEKAVKKGYEKFGSIDVLVNNAGYAAVGLFESASEKEMHQQFDVNVFGLLKVTQAVLPYMITQHSGSIINISSLSGRVGFPAMSIYSATKFAVEGLSESLRLEVKSANIDVYIVEPGGFKTSFRKTVTEINGRKLTIIPDYLNIFLEKFEGMLAHPPMPFEWGDPKEVADLIYNIGAKKYSKSCKFRHVIGKDAKTLLLMKKILPDRVFFKRLHKIFFD